MVDDIYMSTNNFIKKYIKNSEIRYTLVTGVGYLFYLNSICLE